MMCNRSRRALVDRREPWYIHAATPTRRIGPCRRPFPRILIGGVAVAQTSRPETS